MSDETKEATKLPDVEVAQEVAIAKLEYEQQLERHESTMESAGALAHWWRVAKIFSESSFVPAHFRGKEKVGDCLIAIEMARVMGEHPLALMQQSFVVKGRPGWSSQFYIARANRNAGFRSRIRWEHEVLKPGVVEVTTGVSRSAGARKQETFELPNVEVTAFVLDDNGDRLEAEVTTEMAVGEDWVSNPKYQTMFKHMMELRAASFLVRKYAPEVMMGRSTLEEMQDMAAAGQLDDVVVTEGRVLTAEDVLPAQGEPEAESAQPAAQEAPQTEDRLTAEDGKKLIAIAAASSINALALWKIIQEDHGDANKWTDLPASYGKVLETKIREMSE